MPPAFSALILARRLFFVTRLLSALMGCFLLFAVAALLSAAEAFELKNGNRVLLVGGTFIEREGNYGYLNTALTTAWPDRKIT